MLILLVIGGLGLGFDWLLRALELRALGWREGTTAEVAFGREKARNA